MTPAAVIRSRLSRTDRHLRQLRRTERGLERLQKRRRRVLAKLRLPAHPIVMFDSVDLNQIPADAPAVAGYVGGQWPTYHHLAARFPRAHLLSIAVAATEDAEVLDVEPGDAIPAHAPTWVTRQHARGVRRPCLYTSVSAAASLIELLAQHRIPRTSVRLWTAHYTGRPHLCGRECGLPAGLVADATQYTSKALGRNLDETLTAGGFWT